MSVDASGPAHVQGAVPGTAADGGADGATHRGRSRRVWSPPRLDELPPLVNLTLVSGAAIGGSGSSGGITF